MTVDSAAVEHLAVLQKIRNLLRHDDGPEVGAVGTCENCGYEGSFAVAACGCYDEYALYCRPDSRGPGCLNGALYCPVCENGDGTLDAHDIAQVLMLVEKLLASGEPLLPTTRLVR